MSWQIKTYMYLAFKKHPRLLTFLTNFCRIYVKPYIIFKKRDPKIKGKLSTVNGG